MAKFLLILKIFIPALIGIGAIALLSLFTILGKKSQTMVPEVGLVDGHLRPCPLSPNCVSSLATDVLHKVEKIQLQKPFSEVRDRLLMILTVEMEGRVKKDEQHYVHLEFHSRFFGFVDDFEFFAENADAKELEIRAASRVGRSDLGVNRRRVEQFRSLISK